ncbi:hypothetical protein BJ508DRAFT_333196 [Ascobolus immersus RN42]|uniref:Uncharacterized protein n=1 Tax=Ascobolus immersus RN42 TaxID=1160509 RepID=A0A3N4HKG4_ASCIM|nr:hypothetical protein BJ508DRAFT_333196 [Ascobolus immersus RN42]
MPSRAEVTQYKPHHCAEAIAVPEAPAAPKAQDLFGIKPHKPHMVHGESRGYCCRGRHTLSQVQYPTPQTDIRAQAAPEHKLHPNEPNDQNELNKLNEPYNLNELYKSNKLY